MGNKLNCSHIFYYDEKESTTTFTCIICGSVNVVSNNHVEDFKQNNFIAMPANSEA